MIYAVPHTELAYGTQDTAHDLLARLAIVHMVHEVPACTYFQSTSGN